MRLNLYLCTLKRSIAEIIQGPKNVIIHFLKELFVQVPFIIRVMAMYRSSKKSAL